MMIKRKEETKINYNLNLFYLSFFTLFVFEEIIYWKFNVPVESKMLVLIAIFISNVYIKKFKISLLYSSILTLILLPFAITAEVDLIEKTMFRYCVLVISFVCLETLCSKILSESLVEFLCTFSVILNLINLAFLRLDDIHRYSGINPNSIPLGIYSGIAIVFSYKIKNKYISYFVILSSMILGLYSGSRTFILFLILYFITMIFTKKYKSILLVISGTICIYYLFQDTLTKKIQSLLYRIYNTESDELSRTSHIKKFFGDYDITIFGNGLNTTSFIKGDGWIFWYYDMPSIIHFLNDFGIVPTVFLSVLFLALFTFLLKRKDKSSLLLLGTIVVLSITSSNPITPANPGFYITVASLFTILNKYIRPVTTFNQRQQIFRFNS